VCDSISHHHKQLGSGQAEHEIGRKPIAIAFDLLIQPLGCDAVNRCKVGVEHNLMSTDQQDRSLDSFCRYDCSVALALPHVQSPGGVRLIQPVLLFQPFRHVFFGHVGDVFGDERFDFHFEAIFLHLGDLFLPAAVVFEPRIRGDLSGAF